MSTPTTHTPPDATPTPHEVATPRTHAFVLTRGLSGLLRHEKTLQPMLEAAIDFARQLERELAASAARRGMNMSVKIIDETPDHSVVRRVVCRNCGVRLEYVPNDVKRRDGTDYSGGPDGEEWVDCPKCGKKAIINSW